MLITATGIASQDYAALQAAIDSGEDVTLAAGQFHTNQTLLVSGRAGWKLRGAGLDTRIQYDGPPDQPAFRLVDCDRCEFSDFWLTSSGHPAATKEFGFQLWNTPGGDHISTACNFVNVVVGGPHAGAFRHCWSVDSGGGFGNNEYHRWERCRAFGYVKSGWRVHHSQAHGLQFHDCEFNGLFQPGTVGIFLDYGGGFQAKGFRGGYNEAWDYFANNPYANISIEDGNSENSRGMLLVSSGGNGCAVTISNCRHDSDRVPENGNIVQCFMNANLRLEGCSFRLGNRNGYVYCDSYDNTGVVTAEVRSNIVYSPEPYAAGFVRDSTRLRCEQSGNAYNVIGSPEWYQSGPASSFAQLAQPNVFSQAQTVPTLNAARINVQNTSNPTNGLEVKTKHSDGRMSLRHTAWPATSDVEFSEAGQAVRFNGVNVALPAGVVCPVPLLGPTNNASGAKGVEVVPDGARVAVKTKLVGSTSRPEIMIQADHITFNVGGVFRAGVDSGGLYKIVDGVKTYL